MVLAPDWPDVTAKQVSDDISAAYGLHDDALRVWQKNVLDSWTIVAHPGDLDQANTITSYAEPVVVGLIRSFEIAHDDAFITAAREALGYVKGRLPPAYFANLLAYITGDFADNP